MFKITTTHTSNVNGRSQVKATGQGKQRTISWNHADSNDRNHGTAAGTLLLALGYDVGIFLDSTHENNGDKHVFTFVN